MGRGYTRLEILKVLRGCEAMRHIKSYWFEILWDAQREIDVAMPCHYVLKNGRLGNSIKHVRGSYLYLDGNIELDRLVKVINDRFGLKCVICGKDETKEKACDSVIW